jgi:hypothetical protein
MDKDKQTKGLKRDTTDKFYTKPEIISLCKKLINEKIKIDKNDLIIEPSAGDGAFISCIKSLANNYRFYDIKPEHPEVIQQDFLALDIKKIKETLKNGEQIHIIGNPPFGRQSTLAIKFIKYASTFASTISFILPKSFKKDSMKKYFPLNYHLLVEEDLPENSFLVNNIQHDVPCVFQIWKSQDINRPTQTILEPLGYKFINKINKDNIEPTFAIRRVGVYAGKVSSDINDKNIQSHYFIKINDNLDIKKIQILESLNSIKFSENNTVGPRSISKQEFISKYNLVFKDFM